jgi:hypothetical protein
MLKRKYLLIYKTLSLLLLLSSCGSISHNNRNPSGIRPSKCSALVKAIIKNEQVAADNISSHMRRLILEDITTKKSIKDLLENPIYKEFIFNSEQPKNLNKSAVIVELIKKQNPDWTPSNVLKRYRLLFNTCGI